MSKRALWGVLGGAVVALLVPLAAGCSSPGGCRTCGKASPGPSQAQPVAIPGVGAAGPPQPAGATSAPAGQALSYGGQKTCPVTGEALGSMGQPVPVTVKGQTVYVCCRGCATKAQADPDKTLAAVAADRAR